MRGWSFSSARWLSCGALVLSCATPIREDPPSKIGLTNGGDNTDGGGGTGGSGAVTIGTATSQDTSTTASTSSSSSASTTGASSDTSNTSDVTSSSTSDTDTSSTSSSTTDGTGGSGGTTADSTASTSTNTTGEVVIPDNQIWGDTFEDYTADGPATGTWTFLESAGMWTVFSEGSNQYYAAEAEASNRNMTYAGDDWGDVRLQVDLRLREGGDSTRIYLAVRAALAGSKLDYYHAYIRGDGRVQLGYYVGGSTSEDTSAHQVDTNVALSGDAWHTFAVSAVGDVVTAELDGSEIVSGTISGGLSSGFIALGVDSGLADFDNVSVQVP